MNKDELVEAIEFFDDGASVEIMVGFVRVPLVDISVSEDGNIILIGESSNGSDQRT